MIRLFFSSLLIFSVKSTSIVSQVFPTLHVPSVSVPGTCERNACRASDPSFCSETLPGVYRILGIPCGASQTCTDCSVVGDSGAVQCKCERPPNRVSAGYGHACSPTAECEIGTCFRPCETFFYLSECPSDRCSWNYPLHKCFDRKSTALPIQWNLIAPYGLLQPSESVRAKYIVEKSTIGFPISFDSLRFAIQGYLIRGQTPIESVLPVAEFFQLLDIDNSGFIDVEEFSELVNVMVSLESMVSRKERPNETASSTLLSASSPRLLIEQTSSVCVTNLTACNSTSSQSPIIQGAICKTNGNMVYCPLTDSCTSDCATDCLWLNTENFSNNRCVFPTISACQQVGKFFCSTDNACVSNCLSCSRNHTVSDLITGSCRLPWWGDTVSTDPFTWTCRFRKSSNQTCISDMDCVYGNRRCVDGTCAPAQAGAACNSDRDCDFMTSYCATLVPTNTISNITSICAPKLENFSSCVTDSECEPFSLCNQAETPPVCRGLFSLDPGSLSSSPDLCNSGSTLFNLTCAEFPTQSKRLSQSCSYDSDCPTTDENRFGSCACKSWWNDMTDNCRICEPVEGDFFNSGESRRNWLYVKANFCGNIWTDVECLSEKFDLVSFAYYTYMCEVETLRHFDRLSVTAATEGCQDPNVVDYCVILGTLNTVT